MDPALSEPVRHTSHVDALALLIRRRDRCRRAAGVLAVVQAAEEPLVVRMAEAEQAVREAEEELDELDGFSAAGLWSSFRGTQSDDRDRQAGVVERAQAEWDRLRGELEQTRAKRRELEQRCVDLPAAEQDLTEFLDQVRADLGRIEHPLARALTDVVDRQAAWTAELTRLGGARRQLWAVVAELEEWPKIRMGALPDGFALLHSELGGMNESIAAVMTLRDRVAGVADREDLALELPDLPDAPLRLSERSPLYAAHCDEWQAHVRDVGSRVSACAERLEMPLDRARQALADGAEKLLRLAQQGAVILETR